MKMLRILLGFSRRVGQTQGVALAVLLGLLAGFVGGWNLSLVALLLLAVVFNVRARTFFVMWVAGLTLSWMLVPLSFGLGRWLLDHTGLGKWLAANFDEQLIAWFGWDRYTLVGGTLLALFLAVPTVLGLRAWRRGKRQTGQANQVCGNATPGTSKLTSTNPDMRSRRRGSGSALWRRWLGAAEDVLIPEAAPATVSLVRPWALWGLVASLATAALATWLLTPRFAAVRLIEVLTWANGAEVAAHRVRITPWTGHVEIDGLTVADPSFPDHDRLRIGRLWGQLDMTALVRGRLMIESMQVTGVATNSIPNHAAGVVGMSGGDNEPRCDIADGGDATTASEAGQVALGDCLDCWGLAADNVRRLEQLLEGLEAVAALDTVAPRRAMSLSEQRAARSLLGKVDPRVHVRELLAEGFPLSWQLGSDAQLRITDLASGAPPAARPARVVVRIPQHALDLRVTLATCDDRSVAGHGVEFHLFDAPAIALLSPPSGSQRLVCESGMLTFAGRGQITRRGLAITGALRADRLKAHVIGGEPLGGLDPAVWNQALRSIARLQTSFAVRGSLARPTLMLDPFQVVQHIEAELRNVGQHRLAAHVEQCLTGTRLGEASTNSSAELPSNEWLNPTRDQGGVASMPTAAANSAAAVAVDEEAGGTPAFNTAPAWSQPCAAPAEALLAASPVATASPNFQQDAALPPEIAEAVTSDQPPSVEFEPPVQAAQPNAPASVGGLVQASPVAVPESPYVSVRFSPATPLGPGAIDLVTGQDPADRPAPVAYRQVVEPVDATVDWPLDRTASAVASSIDVAANPPVEALPLVSASNDVVSAATNTPADLATSTQPETESQRSSASTPHERREPPTDPGKQESWSKKLSNWSRTTLAQAREIAWPFGKEKLPEEPELSGDEWPSDSSWRVGSKIQRSPASAGARSERTASAERSTSRGRAASNSSDSRSKRRLR
ncbi:MAG: hypothetical protein K2Y37_24315 [Pirellulales bacterium]|nr:hypothetical protein [Pirellulales bacterium]